MVYKVWDSRCPSSVVSASGSKGSKCWTSFASSTNSTRFAPSPARRVRPHRTWPRNRAAALENSLRQSCSCSHEPGRVRYTNDDPMDRNASASSHGAAPADVNRARIINPRKYQSIMNRRVRQYAGGTADALPIGGGKISIPTSDCAHQSACAGPQ